MGLCGMILNWFFYAYRSIQVFYLLKNFDKLDFYLGDCLFHLDFSDLLANVIPSIFISCKFLPNHVPFLYLVFVPFVFHI